MTATDPSLSGPTWYAATMVAAPQRDQLSYDLDVDVCVVGAGLAGLTTAREIARRGWSVAVVEAGRVAAQASGCNGGVVAPGFSEPIEAIAERLGLKRARELWALSSAGVEYVRSLIRETGMAGVGPVDGRLVVRTVDDEDDLLRQVAMMRVDFGADVEAWPTEQVREVLSSPRYFQAMHFSTAFHIHPLNYVLGLAAAAEQAGARIFEATPALAIDPAGVRKRIDTPNGRVRATHIVLAGGVDIGAVYPVLAETVVPIWSYIATTAQLGERLFEAIRYTGAVVDSRRARDCYRIVGGDRLMWGGRIGTRIATPRRLARLIHRDIRKVYPQLEGVAIEQAWSAVTSYAVHKMPQIGELGRGVWLASAFGMHGLNTTAMAGELIARAIVEGDDRWRLFSDYELVWAGGRLGRAAAQMVVSSLPVRDAATSGLAMLRQAVRRRAAEHTTQKAQAATRRAAEEADHRAAQETARLAAEEAARRLAETRRLAMQEAARRAADEVVRRSAQEAEQRAAEEAVRLAGQELGQPAGDIERPAAREADRRDAEDTAQHVAEDVSQRLADALREAEQQSARRAADDATAPAEPASHDVGETEAIPRAVRNAPRAAP